MFISSSFEIKSKKKNNIMQHISFLHFLSIISQIRFEASSPSPSFSVLNWPEED